MQIFGKENAKLIANFSVTKVTSHPFLSLFLSHRAHLTHNIASASALANIERSFDRYRAFWFCRFRSDPEPLKQRLHSNGSRGGKTGADTCIKLDDFL